MAETHTLGRIFVSTASYGRLPAPRAERGWTQENDTPFRFGASLVLRLPFSRYAVVLGWWTAVDEDQRAVWKPLGWDAEYIRRQRKAAEL